MQNLIQRSLTATIFVIVFLGSILLGKITFILLCYAIMVGCLWEFYDFYRESEHPPRIIRGFLMGTAIFLLTAFLALHLSHLLLFSFLAPIFFLFPISTLIYNKKESLISSALTLMGIFYCVIPVCFFLWVGFMIGNKYNIHIILGPVFFIWFNDTGAYVFGNLLGKNTMMEKISPGKTWEGFIGGALSAILLAWFLSKYFHELNSIQWMVLALIVVISGTLGDLVESLYKRELKIKDSGKFFPGHGGVLDRFDSFLMSAPFIYFFLTLIQK